MLFTLTALLTGHLLGGPELSSRTALAISCASRHIGLALLIAVNAPGEKAISLIVAYLFASAIVSMVYIFLNKSGGLKTKKRPIREPSCS
jgi:hypothetical protein